jgi:hypothetical protein
MRFISPLIFCCCFLSSIHPAQAQTCNANMPASTPDTQLTDNGDGTITDTATGLMWKKCMEGVTGDLCDTGAAATFTWQTALQRPGVVNGSGFATYHDWRLPNIKELASIVEEKCSSPTINLTRFPNDPSSLVWSGSPRAGYNSVSAWVVNFAVGNFYDEFRDYDRVNVRLVRGGQ